MAETEIAPSEMDDIVLVATPARRNPVRDDFDAEIHLPATISKEFLSAALLWAVENKAEFGVFHEPQKIVIAFFGGEMPIHAFPMVRQALAYRPGGPRSRVLSRRRLRSTAEAASSAFDFLQGRNRSPDAPF